MFMNNYELILKMFIIDNYLTSTLKITVDIALILALAITV